MVAGTCASKPVTIEMTHPSRFATADFHASISPSLGQSPAMGTGTPLIKVSRASGLMESGTGTSRAGTCNISCSLLRYELCNAFPRCLHGEYRHQFNLTGPRRSVHFEQPLVHPSRGSWQ